MYFRSGGFSWLFLSSWSFLYLKLGTKWDLCPLCFSDFAEHPWAQKGRGPGPPAAEVCSCGSEAAGLVRREALGLAPWEPQV